MLTNHGLVGLVGGRGPESIPQFLIEVWRAAWSMTPASHSSQETAGNPGSNPGGRTITSGSGSLPSLEGLSGQKHITHYQHSIIARFQMRAKNLAGIITCMILFTGLTVYLAPTILPSVAPVSASSRTISLVGTVVGYNYYWNNSNPTITVAKGDTVTINLSSADTTSHRLLIDFDNNGFRTSPDCTTGADQCSTTFPPSTSISFTVNYPPGTYKYYCTIHPNSMVGNF